MTTATHHASGIGQDLWGPLIHPSGYPLAQQYGQPFGTQGLLPQPYAQQQLVPQPQFVPQQPFGQQLFWQQPFGQPQFVSQQPIGQQILAILPAVFAQQAQQMYALAQMCTQLASGSSHQVGLPQAGQRPYPMGV
jgi:hypothetical protein